MRSAHRGGLTSALGLLILSLGACDTEETASSPSGFTANLNGDRGAFSADQSLENFSARSTSSAGLSSSPENRSSGGFSATASGETAGPAGTRGSASGCNLRQKCRELDSAFTDLCRAFDSDDACEDEEDFLMCDGPEWSSQGTPGLCKDLDCALCGLREGFLVGGFFGSSGNFDDAIDPCTAGPCLSACRGGTEFDRSCAE